MALIDNAELAECSEIESELFDKSCNIVRTVETSSGYGTGETSSTSGNIACAVESGGNTPLERNIAAQLQVVKTWRIRLPVGTDVQNHDRIEVGGEAYEVQGIIGAGRSRQLHVLTVVTKVG